MLVLGRHTGERFVIRVGDVTFRVSLERAKVGYARIGFDAPQEVEILREELMDKPEPQQTVMPRRR